MKRILILVTISLFLCSTASAFQGGGGEATKKRAVTKKKTSGTTSAKTTPSRPPASPAPTPATTKAQAVDRERQYEAIRIAERKRVEQGIAGEWSDGTSRLTIIKDGDKFSAVYPSGKGAQVMHGELLADNQLRLTNNSVGKIVNPFDYYVGDFDTEAWIELGGDGSFLTVRFSQAKGGRSLVMKRKTGNPASRISEANTVIWASVSVGQGNSNACAITTTGVPYCWSGGSDDADRGPNLVEVIGGMSIAMVSKGDTSTCWVTTDGVAYCSGGNDYGQLGDGIGNTTGGQNGGDKAVPTAVVGGLRFSVVSVGDHHACGLTTNGEAYCWGDNRQEQLGNAKKVRTWTNPDWDGAMSELSAAPFPVAGGLRFATLSAGATHTCAVTTDGKAYCWGEGSSGQLGNGATERSAMPVAVAGGLKFASVTASKASLGNSFTCGLTTSGSAYCWGVGDNYQLGNGQTQRSSVPVAVAGGLTFTSLSAGAEHVCGITTSGAAYCWGKGKELGTGTNKDALTPVPVAGNLKFTSISSGDWNTCGVTTIGATYCWGSRSPVPVAIPIPTDEDGFKAFFREFSSAVRKRDRAALQLMMSPTIEFPVEITSPSMAFDYLGYHNGRGWRHLEECVTSGTEPYEGAPPQTDIRVTKDARSLFGQGSVLFRRGSDGKWLWVRYLGYQD